jgi:glycerate kinase
VRSLDLDGLDPRLSTTALTVLADVSNPLHGSAGAAHVFAAQKGATPEEIALLDSGLVTWARVLHEETGMEVASLPGSGAAGGTAAAAAALGAAIRPGSRTIAAMLDLEEAVAASDVVLTGEGRLDEQTRHGKGSGHVVDVARAANVPVLAVCGRIDLTPAELQDLGLAGWAESGGAGAPAQALEQATASALSNWLTASAPPSW